MLVFFRAIPYAVALVVSLGFVWMIWQPAWFWIGAVVAWIFCLYLCARLVSFDWREKTYRFFLLTPVLFLASSLGVFLFLESFWLQIALGIVTAACLFFFTEQVFYYLHLPVRYQAYTIEHLSLVLHVLVLYFCASIGFGLQLFLQIPLWLIAPVIFLLMCYMLAATFWVSKIEHDLVRSTVIAGAVLITEFFLALSLLPSGLYVNAAILTIFFYLFLGLTRAHFFENLSRIFLRRYLLIACGLLVLIVGTAQWV